MNETLIDMTHTIFSLVNGSGKTEIKWNYHLLSEESLDSLRAINKVYDTRYFIWLNDTRKKLKPKANRTCRFCGKAYPEVKFSTNAHTFPESVGNKFHLSEFECDICNHKFGIYENDLANFLSTYRTFAEISGKKGIPKYKSRDKELTIEHAYKNAIDINLNKKDIKTTSIYEDNNGILRIQTEGDPYKPINVFKCLLKTALSLVDDEDLKYLSNSIKFLMDDNYVRNPSLDFILSMHQFFVPGNFNLPPFLIHYKKGLDYSEFPAPSLIFIFYIGNLIFQIFVPFHDKDSFIYGSTHERQLYIVPPLIKKQWFDKFGGPFPYFVNLNDNKNVENNIQVQEVKLRKD